MAYQIRNNHATKTFAVPAIYGGGALGPGQTITIADDLWRVNASFADTNSGASTDPLDFAFSRDATAILPGGGGGGGNSGYFTTTARQSKLWTLPDLITSNFSGVGVAGGTHYGAGGLADMAGTDRNWLQFTITAVANATSGMLGSSNWARGANLPKLSTRVRLNQLTGAVVYFALASAGSMASAGAGSYLPTPGVGTSPDNGTFAQIEYDARVGPNWLVGSGDGVNASWIDSGMPATTTDDFLLVIEYSTPTSFKATITNCTTGASVSIPKSTNMPPAALAMSPNMGIANWVAAPNVGPYFEYVYMEHN